MPFLCSRLLPVVLFLTVSFPSFTSAICDETKIDTTQICFGKLIFPIENSDKATICQYVESGMQCFHNDCCTDSRYSSAIQQIQKQATDTGCAAYKCGSGFSLSPISFWPLSAILVIASTHFF